ncbi:hypothetical protein ACSBR2_004347 [Camellia fascicularis]
MHSISFGILFSPFLQRLSFEEVTLLFSEPFVSSDLVTLSSNDYVFNANLDYVYKL